MITALQLGRLGRFCNGAFMIAGVIGIATKNDQPYAFPKWINWDHKERFGSTEDIDIYKHLVNPLPEIPEGVTFTEMDYFWGYRDIKLQTGNWSIYAHLQSDKYFLHCLPLIRDTFRFKDEPKQNDYIGLHIRRGDYDNAYHPLLGKDYYEKAMSYFPGEKFLVFSDNIQEAKQIIGGGAEYSEGRNYIEDFKLLKKCKSFIGSNSSFPLLAAILGEHPEKKMVFPRTWFGPSWQDPVGMAADIHPENAIVI